MNRQDIEDALRAGIKTMEAGFETQPAAAFRTMLSIPKLVALAYKNEIETDFEDRIAEYSRLGDVSENDRATMQGEIAENTRTIDALHDQLASLTAAAIEAENAIDGFLRKYGGMLDSGATRELELASRALGPAIPNPRR